MSGCVATVVLGPMKPRHFFRLGDGSFFTPEEMARELGPRFTVKIDGRRVEPAPEISDADDIKELLDAVRSVTPSPLS